MNKTTLYQQQYTDATYLVERIIMFVALFLAFVMGVRAQEMPDVPKSGRKDGVVYLNDLEDHRWTYYSGVDRSVDGGNYNDNYKGLIYSPNPRNVMITYNGVNDVEGSSTIVKVSIDNENETSFVYYKTLEQGTAEGEYPYTVISNPFSVRPSVVSGGSKVYYGFNGWKIESGGDFIKGYKDGDILPLDAEIVFEKLPYNKVNCISAEIVFRTTWVPLNNIVHRTETGAYTFPADQGGTYETNILVLKKNQNEDITIGSPCTIMMVEPDGSGDYRGSATFIRRVTPAANGTTKIEFTHWRPNGAINAMGRNFIIGRGMIMDATTKRAFNAASDSVIVNQEVRIESGSFTTFTHYTSNIIAVEKQKIVLGNDYDRSINDNSKLQFTGRFIIAASKQLNLSSDEEFCRSYSLSGRFLTNFQDNIGDANLEHCYYLSVTGTTPDINGVDRDNRGHRYLEIQGGEWASIAGGRGESHDEKKQAVTLRMKGGRVRGVIYGAAEYAGAKGTRTFVITGGEVNGWVAAGANGTRATGGRLSGASYVYVGGNARIDSDGSVTPMNRALGGNVFGGGCGYSPASTSGQVTLGTNVVIADNAFVERGVYGGGSFGYCTTTQTSNLYITGGTIGGNVGGVNALVTSYDSKGNPVYDDKEYNPNIVGGVFGGACQNKGGNVNIYMTGGVVNGGLYGGSNDSGTLSGNVNMKITGGQIGRISDAGVIASSNIHGGGYGEHTIISGNVDITLGSINQNTDGVSVYGDVYGGSALGNVNGTETNTTYHTNITLNKGVIHGSIYGGALGQKSGINGGANDIFANIYAPVVVNIKGGSVTNVFGANNINGAPQQSVTVNISGGNMNYVYGGGNLAPYSVSHLTNKAFPAVNVSNGLIRNAVYGGGLGETAIVTGNPQIIMTGGTIGSTETIDGNVTILGGNIFGGGNEAPVHGNTNVVVTGGEVKCNVYGGGNKAVVSGTSTVTIGNKR